MFHVKHPASTTSGCGRGQGGTPAGQPQRPFSGRTRGGGGGRPRAVATGAGGGGEQFRRLRPRPTASCAPRARPPSMGGRARAPRKRPLWLSRGRTAALDGRTGARAALPAAAARRGCTIIVYNCRLSHLTIALRWGEHQAFWVACQLASALLTSSISTPYTR